MSEEGNRMGSGERTHSDALTRKAVVVPQELQVWTDLISGHNCLGFRSTFTTASHWLLVKSEKGIILDKALSETKDKTRRWV